MSETDAKAHGGAPEADSEPRSGDQAGNGGAAAGAGGTGTGRAREKVRRNAYPVAVERLIAEFARLPGIGRRSAERLAFHILKSDRPGAMGLARAIEDVKDRIKHCAVCFNLTDAAGEPGRGPLLCAVCADPARDRSLVLVVEQPKDVIALEQTGMYRGVYHVLMGHISPLDGVGPEALTAADLIRRVESPSSNAGGVQVREVVLGLNPTVEGDGTALYLADQLRSRGVRISRLARGLPTGGQLEYANKAVLADAIQGRQSVE
jgi:recombination protein RecR